MAFSRRQHCRSFNVSSLPGFTFLRVAAWTTIGLQAFPFTAVPEDIECLSHVLSPGATPIVGAASSSHPGLGCIEESLDHAAVRSSRHLGVSFV